LEVLVEWEERGEDRGRRQGLYIVQYGIYGMEAGPEAYFVSTRHFVGYAWVLIFCADHAVVGGVEVEFDDLSARQHGALFAYKSPEKHKMVSVVRCPSSRCQLTSPGSA
jgi:hypothetical protein